MLLASESALSLLLSLVSKKAVLLWLVNCWERLLIINRFNWQELTQHGPGCGCKEQRCIMKHLPQKRARTIEGGGRVQIKLQVSTGAIIIKIKIGEQAWERKHESPRTSISNFLQFKLEGGKRICTLSLSH